VGDSGVGKTSYLHRICQRSFRSNFAATIGVDFQVHNLKVDGQVTALQLWDTAGQERFRSFSKQYFRKADAVLVMYDVTTERSFHSIREWLDNIKQSVEEGTVLAIIGNKIDLPGREVPTEHALQLAQESEVLFFEASAKTGANVSESLQKIARLLRHREDTQLQETLQLSTQQQSTTTKGVDKTNSCCDRF